jgi:hypothetical protein
MSEIGGVSHWRVSAKGRDSIPGTASNLDELISGDRWPVEAVMEKGLEVDDRLDELRVEFVVKESDAEAAESLARRLLARTFPTVTFSEVVAHREPNDS